MALLIGGDNMKKPLAIILAFLAAVVLLGTAAAYFLGWFGKYSFADDKSGNGPNGRQQSVGNKARPLLVQNNATNSAVKSIADIALRAPGSVAKRKNGNFGVAGPLPVDDSREYTDEDGRPYPKSEQVLFAAADRAVERNDLSAARSLASEVVKSKNRELRMKAVQTAGWFGEEAMAELTPYLSDPDPEIAETAHDEWMTSLQNIEDDGLKAGAIKLALEAIKDKTMLEDVAGELVGIDELAAIQVIADVIEQEGQAVPNVLEAYESITGEEWSGFQEAEQWLAENYVADDD